MLNGSRTPHGIDNAAAEAPERRAIKKHTNMTRWYPRDPPAAPDTSGGQMQRFRDSNR